METYPSRDGLIRSAKIKTPRNVITRPIQNLVDLEITDDESEKFTVNSPLPVVNSNDVDVHVVNNDTDDSNQILTRSERVSNKPSRLGY